MYTSILNSIPALICLTLFDVAIASVFFLFAVVYFISLVRVRKVEATGVRFMKPMPFFGNVFRVICGLDHFSVPVKQVYDSFQTDRYVALFEFYETIIILRDQELIKAITEQDFENFHDVPYYIDEDIDPMVGRTLLTLKGQKWRQMRSTLSPAFTAAKMKNMFDFIVTCSSKVVNFYTTKIDGKACIEIDMKDVCNRYAIDVIASTAFSFEVDSLSQSRNKFYNKAVILSAQSMKMVLKFVGFKLFPTIMKFFKMRLMAEESISYFRNHLQKTIAERERSGEYRPDMIHLLLEAKKGALKHEETDDNTEKEEFAAVQESYIGLRNETLRWEDDDYLAQCIMFILAGFKTTATELSFLMYELALNPDIQTRLQEEVDSTLEKNDGKLTYDSLMKMEYMDMVVSECLRKWPAIPFINRLCHERYDLGPVREGSLQHLQMEKDESVCIPVYAIHMDPGYWPNPEKFDPERFSKSNKRDIKPFTYLPFGTGPRNCIGSRFALMEMKILATSLLSKFTLDVSTKTAFPMKLSTNTPFLGSKDGFILGMKPRSKA